ncbi:MAG: hypothetical protein JXA42_08085 [Anaerolineales bacterium]|nr:hypothetical protein [Anaerolineales bacterium]
MNERTVPQVIEIARGCKGAGKRWHFHVLPPGCHFSPQPDRFVLVMENRSDGETFAVYGDDPFIDASQELVTLLHGDTVLDQEKGKTQSVNPAIQQILERAKVLIDRKIYWHHHMLFPDCVFNRHAGLWNLVFENPETGEVLETLYPEEPLADLRRLEVLYFSQKPD